MRFFFCYCIEKDYLCKNFQAKILKTCAFYPMRVRAFVGYFIVTQYVKLIIITMKKFLLSIFCCLMAVFAVQAQEPVTLSCGTEITSTSGSYVDGKIKMSTDKGSASTAPAYNTNSTELRFYYHSSGNGGSATLTTDGSIEITSIVLTASSTSDTPNVKYNVDGGTDVSGTWNGTTMTISNISAKETFKFRNANTTTNKQLRIKSITITYTASGEGGEEVITLEKPIISPEDTKFNDGETLIVEITAEEGATIHYTLDGNDPTGESEVYLGPLSITETTTVKAIAVKDGCNDSKVAEAIYTKIEEGVAVDVLNRELTGVGNGSTTYVSWSGKTATSSAVYAGQSAGGNDAIQIRTTNSNSGIVTTTSGGKAKKVVVEWQDNTSKGRTLQVYGNNNAYTSPNELYATAGNDNQGELLGTIVCGTSTELVIEGDYKYIGLRSASGAMYLTSVEITWDNKKSETFTLNVTSAGWATLFLADDVIIPDGVTCYTVSSFSGNYVVLEEITTDVLPSETAAIVEATEGDYLFESNGEKTAYAGTNYLKGTAANEYITEEAYVLSVVDGEVGLYKAEMTDGTWLNNANKAYLPASSVPNKTVEFYGFDWGGTTGIENIEGVAGNNFGEGAIYDLTGRKINSIAVTGIYIIDGKKVFIRK